MKKVIQTEEQPSFSSSEHQFQPREDDDQTMWDVIEILKERKGHYFVQWAGDDPQTGKPWTPTWARKVDVTDDLVEKWKAQKAERKERAAARRKKSGKRGSTGSTSRATTGSTRLSALTTKSATPTTVNVPGPSSRRTVRLGQATTVKGEESLDDEALPPGNQAVPSGSVNGARKGRATPSTKGSARHKRKRGSSVESTSSTTSLPIVVATRKSNVTTPPARPRKKRRLDSTPSVDDDSQEESHDNKRVVANGRNTRRAESEVEVVVKNTQVIVFEEEEESSGYDEIVATPIPSRKTKSKSRLEQEVDSSSRVNRTRQRAEKLVNNTQWSIHDKRAVPSPPLSRTTMNGTITGKTGLSSFGKKMVSGEIQPGTLLSKPPLVRYYDGTVRELSPNTTRRLKQFDAELRAIEAERRKQEAEERRAKQQAQMEAEGEGEESGLEYCDEFPVSAAPFDHPPEPSPPSPSPTYPPLSKEIPLSTADPFNPFHRPRASKKVINNSDDSYRQGIVPETEVEDSGNTQSQDPYQSQSQAAPPGGSPPSMAVEPPASLRSPAPTPSRPTLISKMRPRTPTSRSESLADMELPHIITLERIDEELQGASQDADESAAFDSIEQESLEIQKKQQSLAPIEDKEVRKSGKDGAGTGARLTIVEDIEQFTSPEKRARAGFKPDKDGKGKKARTSSPESDAIRKHGMELADAARQAKLQNRAQAPKRPLADVLQRHKSTSIVMAQLSATGEIPMSSIAPPSSGSVLVPDSESGLPEVSEEVVREMERAYVNLDGGASNRMDEDTLEDMGSSQRPVDGGRVVRAIREEEEESTQDLLREAAGEQAEGVKVPDAEGVPGDRIELRKSPREQETSVSKDQVASDMLQGASDEVQSLPGTSSDRADKLEALLQQEQMRNQELTREIASLRQALDLAKDSANSNQQLAQKLKQVEAAHEQEKASWDAERTSFTAAAEDATKAKEIALTDVEFFRAQYTRASGFVTSTREENQELEKRAKIAEDQAKSGVAMIKATYENKITELERHMEKWQTMATFLIQKDHRTDNDQLRQRAAEHPELKAKCQSLEESIKYLSAKISQLEKERHSMAGELEHWKQEADRSSAELNHSRAEMERFIHASSASGEMVYRCLWRTEENKPCDEVVQTIEELRNHLFSAGHIRSD